ncbi:hypothetical protein ABKN59_007432 [Abortiporus biennis]
MPVLNSQCHWWKPVEVLANSVLPSPRFALTLPLNIYNCASKGRHSMIRRMDSHNSIISIQQPTSQGSSKICQYLTLTVLLSLSSQDLWSNTVWPTNLRSVERDDHVSRHESDIECNSSTVRNTVLRKHGGSRNVQHFYHPIPWM